MSCLLKGLYLVKYENIKWGYQRLVKANYFAIV